MPYRHVAQGLFEARGDVDWFRMRLVAGQTYQISGPSYAILTLVRPDGQAMTFPVPFGNLLNFVAPVSGDFFLSVASIDGPGFYEVSITDVLDPIPASADTPRTLAVNGSVTVTAAENPSSSSRNDDWFEIHVVAGQSYLLATTSPNSFPSVYFASADGTILAIEGYLGQGGRQAHFTATETGTIYAGVSTSGGSGYSVALTAVADDHGDTPGQAGALTVGTTVNGSWETPGDDDAYAVTLVAGQSYRLTTANPDPGQPAFFNVLDSAGHRVWTSKDQGSPDQTTFSPAADGTYYVVVGIRESNSNPDGQWNYSLTVEQIANELADNVLTTGILAVNGQLNGVFDTRGDADWAKIVLGGGQSYLFTMNASSFQGCRMGLYDAQGRLIREAGTTNFGSQLHHTIETTGIYYVAAISGTFGGTYSLTAQLVADDYADNSATTGRVVNGVMSGVLEVTNDVDWFAVDLIGGKTYALDSGLNVYDGAGTLLTMANWGDQCFTAATTGTYYIGVSGYQGDYVYGIIQINDDFLESAATTGVARMEIEGTAATDSFVSSERYEFFDGLAGDDLFLAGSGYDFFYGNSGIDTLSYAGAAAGLDINLALGRSLLAGQAQDIFASIENVIGSSFDDKITGSAAANLIDGGAGADQMAGGNGNDLYYVDDAGDVIVEAANGGTDIVYATVGYTLNANASVELLTATSIASTYAVDMTGNNLDNTIWGNNGANTLSGGIGGHDTLVGFLGNDIYLINNTDEVVVENAGEGTDIVYVNSSYTLSRDASIELLSTYSIAGTQAYDMTGNNLDNTIWGNRGNNTLSGGIGGHDTLVGFLGNDIYLVNNTDEVIVENAGEGTDIVYVNSSYTLSKDASIELLSTFSIAGTQNYDMTGNNLDNTIWGNRGNNTLSGGIGGHDTLVGFLGDDIYLINNGDEAISELVNEGTDIVYTGLSYTLSAGASIELLSTNSIGGSTAINLTGNELSQTIWGNAGANVLNGGLGADTLSGFGGADSFAFTTALGSGNVDAITDFVAGTDKLALDDAIFGTGIGTPGTFNTNAFFAGTAAHDGDDRIIYNSANGQLLYDADGNGAGAAVLFATLSTGLTLATGDFQVI